jgi:hypothetical protein
LDYEVLASRLVHKIQEAAIRRAEGKFNLGIADNHLLPGILEIRPAGGHEGTSGKHRSQRKEEKPRAGITPAGTTQDSRSQRRARGSNQIWHKWILAYITAFGGARRYTRKKTQFASPALGVRDVFGLGARDGRAGADHADHSESSKR